MGTSAVFSQYPILMQRSFGIEPKHSASVWALGVCLSLTLYSPAAHLAERRGPLQVLESALGIRLAAFTAMFLLALAPWSGREVLALVAMIAAIAVWALQSVGSTSLVARLSATNEGSGIGALSATSALAGAVGAFVGGAAADRWGHWLVPGLAACGIGLGLLSGRRLGSEWRCCQGDAGTQDLGNQVESPGGG
jgi:predicted MFS family arabinose efflux permease